MGNLANELGPYVLVGIVLGSVAVIVWIAKKSAFFSFALGLPLLAVPIAQWATFDRHYFRSDGSVAGLVIFAAYAFVGFFCGVLGITLTASAIARFVSGEVSRRNRIIFFCVAGALMIGAQLYTFYGRDLLDMREIATTSLAAQEQEVVRKVPVHDYYVVDWKSQGRAPALKVSISAADLYAPRNVRHPVVEETRSGPLGIDFAIPTGSETGAWLGLSRDTRSADPAVRNFLDDRSAPLEALWVSEEDGGWKLLGIECAERTKARFPLVQPATAAAAAPREQVLRCYSPPNYFVRHLPRLFGLDRVRLHDDRGGRWRGCTMRLRYRGRVVWLDSRGDCGEREAMEALIGAAALLDRLGRDAESPPSVATRVARAWAAAAECEETRKALGPRLGGLAPPQRERLDSVCEHATRVAAAELKAAPIEASTAMLRALDARGEVISPQHASYVNEIAAALIAAGQDKGREMLWAHAMRFGYGSGSPEDVERRGAAAGAIFALAPSVAADDPVWDVLWRAAYSGLLSDHPPQGVALFAAWERKAAAELPGTDAAVRARYAACMARLFVGLEHEALVACADELIALWEARGEAAKSFQRHQHEPSLAEEIAKMYAHSTYGTKDFARSAAGIRRVIDQASKRLGAGDAGYLVGLRNLEQAMEEGRPPHRVSMNLDAHQGRDGAPLPTMASFHPHPRAPNA